MPSHISAGRLERKSATIPASAFRHLQFPSPQIGLFALFPALLFVLSAANPRPHLLDSLSICFSLCALFSNLLIPAIRKQDFPALSCRYYSACLPVLFFFRIQFLFSILSSTLVFLTLPLHCSLIGFLFLFLIFRSRSPWACLTEAEINHHELDPSSKIDHDTYLIAPGVSHFDSEPGFPHPSHLIRSTPTHLQVTHP